MVAPAPASLLRYYLSPSLASGPPGEAESLELLARIIGGDDTSRLYRRLVVEKLASTAGPISPLRRGTAVASPSSSFRSRRLRLEKLKASSHAVIREVVREGCYRGGAGTGQVRD
jgi:zinc protease